MDINNRNLTNPTVVFNRGVLPSKRGIAAGYKPELQGTQKSNEIKLTAPVTVKLSEAALSSSKSSSSSSDLIRDLLSFGKKVRLKKDVVANIHLSETTNEQKVNKKNAGHVDGIHNAITQMLVEDVMDIELSQLADSIFN